MMKEASYKEIERLILDPAKPGLFFRVGLRVLPGV